ncbi:hypothetical protein ACIPL1_27835 [Pseudomonas sp. NPDC090202]|uniref:hypothetical protein n=1 Tax=Pseudomonas sp. NPDC090202 TaxID=3364476 RepID=UPI00380D23C4
MATEKGAAIYVSAADLEGLSHARGLLGVLLESADVISLEMAAALEAISSVTDKAHKARRASGRHQVVRRALKVAEQA